MQTSVGNKYLVPMSNTHQKLKLPPCVSPEFMLSFLMHAKGCYGVRPEHSSASEVTALHPPPCSPQTDRNPI